MKKPLFILTFLLSINVYGQYSDTTNCNGGLLEFVVNYDQQTCDTMCNGNYSVIILTGIGPYSYSVTGPSSYTNNTSSDLNLCPGSYSITVDDVGQGISCNLNFTILPLTLNSYTTNIIQTPTSTGLCDGIAEIILTGGVPSYSYQWLDAGMVPIPGATNSILSGLCAGTYYVQFWDNTPPCGSGTGGVGSSGSAIVAITLYDPVIVTVTSTVEATCPGDIGWINYSVSGGSGTYNDPYGGAGYFSVSDGASGTITICDNQGNCGTATYALLGWPVTLFASFNVITTSTSCSGSCDGMINVIDTWAPGLDQYSLDGFSWQSSTVFNNLCSGNYTVYALIPNSLYTPLSCIIDLGMYPVGQAVATAPTPDLLSLSDALSECSINSLTAPTATDNCGAQIIGTTNTTFPINASTQVTWAYSDSGGNQITQVQNVIIDDVTAPVPDTPTLVDVVAECSIDSLIVPTATDNCEGAIIGSSSTTFPVTSSTIVTWIFSDSEGNQSTQSQNIIINDVTAPVQDVTNLTDISSECSINSLVVPTATDNCEGQILGTSTTTFPITSSTTVTWTFMDTSGNQSTQVQNVNVQLIDISTTVDLNGGQHTISANSNGYDYQWIENCGTTNNPIANEINQNFAPINNGSYGVILTNGSCSDTSNCITINDVSIDDHSTQKIRIHPNPNNGKFTVEIPSATQLVMFNLVDNQGRLIHQSKINNTHSVINLVDLDSGIYYLHVTVSNDHQVIPIFVSN